jgi:hypothetical protein
MDKRVILVLSLVIACSALSPLHQRDLDGLAGLFDAWTEPLSLQGWSTNTTQGCYWPHVFCQDTGTYSFVQALMYVPLYQIFNQTSIY